MKRRILAGLLAWVMLFSLLPATALAAPWDGDTVIRFYVIGAGSVQGYNVEKQPMSGGESTTLYVVEDFALIEALNITNSDARPGGTNQGDAAVRAWLDQYANGVPSELANIEAIVETVNTEYEKRDISTRLQEDYFNGFQFESANWEGSDKAYHVHVRLIRNECTVTFDENYTGAPALTTETVGKGTAVSKPEDPTREDYTFTGWYEDQACTKLYNFDTLVVENITLYAGWKKNEPEVDPVTVTKTIATVNGESADADTVLYKDDDVTWTITVTNNTDEQIKNLRMQESLGVTVSDGDSDYPLNGFSLAANQTKTYTAQSLDSLVTENLEGEDLTNTVTVTYERETYTASATNDVGYTINVTYDGNGGTLADGTTQVERVVHAPEFSYDYSVEETAIGFTNGTKVFQGWSTTPTGDVIDGDTLQLENADDIILYAIWDDETPVPEDGDVFYYINLPGARTELSTDPDEYRFLTFGGSSNVPAGELENYRRGGNPGPQFGEENVKNLIDTWPESGENVVIMNFDPGKNGEEDYSAPMDAGSTLIFGSNGEVTEFELHIGDAVYSSDASKSKDENGTLTNIAYGIRWGKFSYASSYTPEGGTSVSTAHVDGVLYAKNVKVSDVVSKLYKAVSEFPSGVESAAFNFTLDKTGDDSFTEIQLTATVSTENSKVALTANESDSDTILTYGTYTVTENLTDEQAALWVTPNTITFDVNTDGSIAIHTENGTAVDTITNTAVVEGMSVKKTVASVGGVTVSDQTSIPAAVVGDTIEWTITVTNEGNVTQSTSLTLTENLTGVEIEQPGADAHYEVSNGNTITVSNLPAGESETITVTYTVQQKDKNTQITNSVTYGENETEEAPPVSVSNSDLRVTKALTAVNKADGTAYTSGDPVEVGDELTYTVTVENAGEVALSDVEVTDTLWNKNVEVISQHQIVNGKVTISSIPVGGSETITYTYTVVDSDIVAGWIKNTATVAGGGETTTTPEVTIPAGSVTIRPADITIYTGGDGYNGVVEDNAGTIVGEETQQGLPEPGYYIELPAALDAALKAALGVPSDTTLDLSPYLTFTYDDGNGTSRTWKLERYDKKTGNDSMAYSRYIYRILPYEADDGTEIPVRLQFTNQETDEITTSDNFSIALENLYQTYDMTIYAGALDQGQVRAVLAWPNGGTAPEHDVTVGNGVLTVRGITNSEGNATTTQIETTDPAEEVDNVTAVIADGTSLYINKSELEVAPENDVQLLVDSVVSMAVQDLKDSAVEQVTAITDDHEAQFYYLDLVDTDNGNAYVTTKSQPVILYFPYPEGTDEDTEFYIVHYVDQDRDLSAETELGAVNNGTEDFTIQVYSADNATYQLENTDQGIKITVSSFSPFGLFWEEDSGSSGGGSSGGGSSRPSRPALNTEDHYSYIIGYSDGYLRPYGTITRGEVATIFFRLLTDDTREEYWSQVNDYTDCNSDLWCNNAISTLTNMGIIDGFSDGTFRPYAKITRAQFAKIAVGFFETTREDYQGYFTDVDIDAWYTEYVEAAARVGLIEGFNDGTFRPNTNITRAQACVIVNRALGRAPDEDRLLDEDEMITWPDNTPDDWFYADMQEATNSHDYTWTTVDGERVENWTDKLAQRDWAALEHAWSTAHSAPGGEVTE